MAGFFAQDRSDVQGEGFWLNRLSRILAKMRFYKDMYRDGPRRKFRSLTKLLNVCQYHLKNIFSVC